MDRRLWVKVLWKKEKAESLKLSKPEELKRFIVMDLWEDTRRQIVNSGKIIPRGRKRGKLRLPKAKALKWISIVDQRMRTRTVDLVPAEGSEVLKS
jgi:hypothetical protein